MRAAALGALLYLVGTTGVGDAAVRGGVDASMSCSGSHCTLTLKNTSGKSLFLVSFVLPRGATVVSATDPDATSQQAAGANGKLETIPAKQCALFHTGSQDSVACEFGDPPSPQLRSGAKTTISFATKAPLAANAKVAVCLQGPGLVGACTDVPVSSSTTGSTAGGGHPDLEVIVNGPDAVHVANSAPVVHATYTVEVMNRGTVKDLGSTLEVLARYHDSAHTISALLATGTPACSGSTRYVITCKLPELAPKQSVVYRIVLRPQTSEFRKQQLDPRIEVDGRLRDTDRSDPKGNNEDSQRTYVSVR